MTPVTGEDIPAFLRRGKDGKVPNIKAPKTKGAKKVKAGVFVKAEMPNLPEGLRWAANNAEESGSQVRNGIVPLRWSSQPETIREIAKSIEEAKQKKEERLAEFKSAMAERKLSSPPPLAKKEFGTDLRLVFPKANNPSGKATKFGARLEAGRDYTKKNPKASAADVMKASSLSRSDVKYAEAKGLVKIDAK